MKIDKVVFSCSVEYSPFWNTQARVFKLGLGIEPVCLLFGKKSDTDMTEEHGRVVEVATLPGLPWNTQMTWLKFIYPLNEPETTWMIGDIDMVPLQRHHFIEAIADIPSDAILHLNASGISMPRLGILDGFRQVGCMRRAKDNGLVNGGADLPAHYFVAKGKQFKVFTTDQTFEEQVRYMVKSHRYGLGPMGDDSIAVDNEYWYYWCAEEHYSSYLLQAALERGKVTFVPIYYNNVNDMQRIDRGGFNEQTREYSYTPVRLADRQFVDIHCARPYAKQAAALQRIIDLSGICHP